MKIKTLDSEKVFEGRVFDIRQDKVRLSNGRVANLDIIEHGGSVTILPLDNEDHIWFVCQYRHPAGEKILELPAGTLEHGEDPLDCARRELREEIGMEAKIFKKIGEFFLAPGYSTEFMHVFLARNLFPAPLPRDEDEIIEIKRFPVEVALEEAASGQILDAKTIAALFMAQEHITLTN
jgi:ADP-ribose pyrophosphatase